ncbi:MAG: sigma-70 family RNA polymerase sigma factor [Planctomycetota bacterium]
MSLADLLQRAKQGDEAARASLVERFYPSVQQMVHRELALDLRHGRPWLASLFSTADVVQDVFIGVLRDLPGVHGEDERAFEGYLASTVTHRLLRMLRFHQAGRRDGRRGGRALLDAAAVTAGMTSPTQAARRSEQTDHVNREVERLAPRDQIVLEMRFWHGASYQDIATACGMPSSEAARKAVRSARARLLVRLRAKGLDEL